MHRTSDSVFGALKKILETTKVYPKQSTTSKQHPKQQNRHYKYQTIQKIPNSKDQKPTNLNIPKSKTFHTRQTIQNFSHLRNLANIIGFLIFGLLDVWMFDFWIFGFSCFWIFAVVHRCLNTVMDIWATCACPRVVGGVSIYMYPDIEVVFIYIYIYIPT